jgi:hypothetical protein
MALAELRTMNSFPSTLKYTTGPGEDLGEASDQALLEKFTILIRPFGKSEPLLVSRYR